MECEWDSNGGLWIYNWLNDQPDMFIDINDGW